MSGEERARSKELDRIIKRDYKHEREIIKLLLLGTGQFILHHQDYSHCHAFRAK
jgi:hypothetical protein